MVPCKRARCDLERPSEYWLDPDHQSIKPPYSEGNQRRRPWKWAYRRLKKKAEKEQKKKKKKKLQNLQRLPKAIRKHPSSFVMSEYYI